MAINAVNTKKMSVSHIPATGFLRVNQIIGDLNNGIPPLIPVSSSTWWAGVKSGRFPASIHLGRKLTVWRVEDIRKWIDEQGR